MKELNREMLERLYKKQKRQISFSFAFSVGVIVLNEIYLHTAENGGSDAVRGLFILLISASVIYSVVVSKKSVASGHTRRVRSAIRLLMNDFTSDSAVNMLFVKMGLAKSYAEKTRFILLISDIYHIRGNDREAIDMLATVDRSGFEQYPDLGMSLYAEYICIYADLKDYDSVLRAYADGESFIDRACDKNYVCCNSATGIMIALEKARGNYRKALDMRLYKNEIENLFNSSIGRSQQGTNLTAFLRGCVFTETAELFYLNGDYANAAKYLDIGGPMITASPAFTLAANKLSSDIREALSKA